MIDQNETCLNCRTALVGRYCYQCGQDSSGMNIGQLSLYDFLEKLVGLDHRSLFSFKSILFEPGQLAVDYVEGRRQAHYSPIKIYFFISVVFFFLIQLSPGLDIEIKWYGLFIETLLKNELHLKSMTGIFQIDNWVSELSRLPAESLSKIVYGSILTHAAQAMFLLLPISAGILKALNPKKQFNEHLMLSLNLLIFYQIVLSLSALPLGSAISNFVAFIVNAVVIGYTWLSFRRFYKSSKLGALLRLIAYIGFIILSLQLSMLVSLWVSFKML
jgi:hypothetical protein